MLKTISTTEFIETLIIVTCLYYVVVLLRYYHKEIGSVWKKRGEHEHSGAGSGGNGEISGPVERIEMVEPAGKITVTKTEEIAGNAPDGQTG